MNEKRSSIRAIVLVAVVAIVFVLVLTPIRAGSTSSLAGCILGMDVVTRHDLGGNPRIDYGRGPDCGDTSALAVRGASAIAAVGAAALLLLRR